MSTFIKKFMYVSKALLPARGQLKANILFRFSDRSSKVETGYSQSVNVARHHKQMFEEATLNAFYKLNNRVGGSIFSTSENNELEQEVTNITILSYEFRYFEDRIYNYKRRNINGKYRYVITRKGKRYKYVKPRYVNKRNVEDSVL